MSNHYQCHGIEWDSTETCLMCDAITTEQARIIQAIRTEADTWVRPTSFSYRQALRDLADKLETADSNEPTRVPESTIDELTWDEYDGQVIDGIRYANTFTFNMAKNSRIIGANQERSRIIKLLEESDSVCNEWAIALIKGEIK